MSLISRIILHSLLFIGIITSFPSYSQTTQAEQTYRIVATDGNQYVGYILEKATDYIKIRTSNIGDITILFNDIEIIEKINGAQSNGSSTRAQPIDRPNSNFYPTPRAYFLKTSGFGLEKGESYYHNVAIVFSEVQIGITDFFSLGTGIMPFSVDGEIPFWVQPKFSIPIEKDKIEIGITSANGSLLGGNANFGAVLSDVTIGNPTTHVNIGIGKAYENSEWKNGMLYTLSGALKMGRVFTLISENYVIEDFHIYSLGVKQAFNNGSLEYGLVQFETRGDGGALLPWFGVNLYITK
jgi:hypothetical protein